MVFLGPNNWLSNQGCKRVPNASRSVLDRSETRVVIFTCARFLVFLGPASAKCSHSDRISRDWVSRTTVWQLYTLQRTKRGQCHSESALSVKHK